MRGTVPAQGDRTRYQARLVEAKKLTDTTKHFTWEGTGPRPFAFTAGQFISLHLEHNGSDDVRRRLKARGLDRKQIRYEKYD